MNRLKHAFSALSLLLFLGGQTFVSAKLKFPFKVKTNYTAPIEKLEFHDTIAGVYSQLHNEIKNINIGATNPAFNGTVLVAHKGKLIFEESYGVSNRAIGLKNTPKTPTQIASITKTFTGTSVLWLEQRGFLDIKDPVQKYIWEFPYADITIEHLLSHRSGLPEYLKFSPRYWNSSEPMYNESLLSMFSTRKFGLKFAPGTSFDYCNSNFAMLALLIERITKMPYKEFVNQYIFEPLNMQNSFVYDPMDTYNFSFAKSYKANFSDFNNTFQDGVYGDKGIFTTVEDLYRWDRALYKNDFINEKFKQDAFTPTRDWSVAKNYGLGWRIKCYPNGEKYVYHTGWWHGYQGIFARYIKDDFTIIILSNRYISGISKNSEEIYKVAQQYLGLTELS
ncbi:serine hydrolase domain-containing protein [Ornithobacterium rhinotracheale]|uniref:serine hydrolase domain-containing protein n=1 Tax=Ornithobacterium rhinotracheale TaxID=28251 RepID=UPI003FA43F83